MIRYLLSRIGCLIFLGGVLALVIGFAAVRSGEPEFDILLVGVGLTFLGFFMWNKLRPRVIREKRASKFRRRKDEDRQEMPHEDDGWK